MSLRRSRDKKMIGGVVGGFAEFLGMDANLLRVVFVVFSVLSTAFPGILVYLVLWLLIPSRSRLETSRQGSLAS